MPSEQHPSLEQAAARYARHRNTLDHVEYVARLTRLIELLRMHAPDARRVLDFGCGADSVMTSLLSAAGYDAHGHDPIHDIHADLSQPFDAIIASETLEHVASPRDEFARIHRLLMPSGLLIATTRFHSGPASFADWWYIRDVTHVCFFSTMTFDFIAAMFGFTLLMHDNHEAVVLRKRD
ncbi:MAG: class I SAM-dependent methyltransferase [Planctomycetota bacterium]